MHDGAEIGAKVNKHGAKSLETQATSDNVQYDKRACHTPTVITLPNVRQSHPTHHAYLLPLSYALIADAISLRWETTAITSITSQAPNTHAYLPATRHKPA